MTDAIGPQSMINKMYPQLYHHTCSFEEVLSNVTHQMWVTFTLSKAVVNHMGPHVNNIEILNIMHLPIFIYYKEAMKKLVTHIH